MWRDWLLGSGADVCFAPPTSTLELADGERTLGVRLPEDQRSLLAETNGVSVEMQMLSEEESFQVILVWSMSEMIEQNGFYWNFDGEGLNPSGPLSDLLFFAAMPNGDLAAFPVHDGQADGTEIIVVSHEDFGGRNLRSRSLRDYLTPLLEVAAEYQDSPEE